MTFTPFMLAVLAPFMPVPAIFPITVHVYGRNGFVNRDRADICRRRRSVDRLRRRVDSRRRTVDYRRRIVDCRRRTVDDRRRDAHYRHTYSDRQIDMGAGKRGRSVCQQRAACEQHEDGGIVKCLHDVSFECVYVQLTLKPDALPSAGGNGGNKLCLICVDDHALRKTCWLREKTQDESENVF